MKNKLGQETAFPLDGQFAADAIRSNNIGMSKRFYAACAAMQGILSCGFKDVPMSGDPFSWNYEEIAECAFKAADELLKQEKL